MHRYYVKQKSEKTQKLLVFRTFCENAEKLRIFLQKMRLCYSNLQLIYVIIYDEPI